jgi:hypothetical protein
MSNPSLSALDYRIFINHMNIFIYILNIFFIALPLAVFEIVIEKKQGWGSGWSKDWWYARPLFPNSSLVKGVSKKLNIELPLGYHFIMFGFVIPVLMVFEYVYIIPNILIVVGIFLGVLVVEDFLWFLFNWNFDSLTQLLKGPQGTIFWHKKWLKISSEKYVPRSYAVVMLISLILLLIAFIYREMSTFLWAIYR